MKLEQGAADYTGGANLRIDIEVYGMPGLDIKDFINQYGITTKSVGLKGSGYNIRVEDCTDMDFNDYSISIVSWKTKG